MAEEQKQHPQAIAGSGTRHVGPTLEAEGNFADVLGTELPLDMPVRHSPDAAHPGADAGNPTDAMDVRTFGEERDGSEDDPISTPLDAGPTLAQRLEETPDPLKTRLPGDTSSDPHTDLGPDNATNVRRRAS